jgi:DNA-binding PadR family transcriptional regulator
VWGKWLLDELAEHGHTLSPGTLYPALLRMERNGWLERTGDPPHARARQAFRITPEGRHLLQGLRREVTELYREVVLAPDSRHDAREARAAPKPKRTARKRTNRRRT